VGRIRGEGGTGGQALRLSTEQHMASSIDQHGPALAPCFCHNRHTPVGGVSQPSMWAQEVQLQTQCVLAHCSISGQCAWPSC
jgi:hypothetical protein